LPATLREKKWRSFGLNARGGRNRLRYLYAKAHENRGGRMEISSYSIGEN